MRRARVIVALSGGVDSAVAAALLQRQGYRVSGVYLKYASELVRGFVDVVNCTWQEDLAAVQAVGRRLSIPVQTVNVEQLYHRQVISRFLDGYARGRTPNPDVLCNQHVKFGWLADWARSRGARLATGHYARISRTRSGLRLLAGVDVAKDQSYFLCALPQPSLAQVLFPIGRYRKPEVRTLARAFGLPNADRPDSQGVCFVGPLKVRRFLQSVLPPSPGPIIASNGQRVGTHAGLGLFTVGQRHGLGVGGGQPYYVAAKLPATGTLIVGRGHDDPLLYSQQLLTAPVHWLVPPPTTELNCRVRLRYRQPLVGARVAIQPTGSAVIRFDQPQRAVAPGQYAVLYRGAVVLGGAEIERVWLPALNVIDDRG
ncbi:MAG: tRNA 2-thiouridine(34) synthase MnmA [Candidatus Kerfeldbacteria bacterium]|nr:tRNA 2-thiouridine(34) synthase MnmA [Candidatus Kerfeldbacteria bacterium]